MKLTITEIIKECRKLAKSQGLTFRRSKKIGLINGKACYEIESGIQYKTLHEGCLDTVYEVLISEYYANQ